MPLPAPLVHIHDQALPEADFALLWRKVRALGTERLRQGCNVIASRNSAYCANISDFNDRQMCYELATASQQPCTSMTDRTMQLACYGMSITQELSINHPAEPPNA